MIVEVLFPGVIPKSCSLSIIIYYSDQRNKNELQFGRETVPGDWGRRR
jgi:hypothetical protein